MDDSKHQCTSTKVSSFTVTVIHFKFVFHCLVESNKKDMALGIKMFHLRTMIIIKNIQLIHEASRQKMLNNVQVKTTVYHGVPYTQRLC